jgi:hypothetical protein
MAEIPSTMHRVLLRYETQEIRAFTGCFLTGAAAVALLACRTSPAAYPILAFLLGTLVLDPPKLLLRVGARIAPGDRRCRLAAVALPLAYGAFQMLRRPLGHETVVWLLVFAAAGLGTTKLLAALDIVRQNLDEARKVSGSELARWIAASPERSAGGSVSLLAFERLILEGEPSEFGPLLDGKGMSCLTRFFPRRALRLRALAAFMQSDLTAARQRVVELLAAPIDLEEGRQHRAFAAYLALADGAPWEALVFARAAVGPPSLAGEGWTIHSTLLQAWCLLETDAADQAAATLGPIESMVPRAGPLRLGYLALAAWCAVENNEPATALARRAVDLRALLEADSDPDPLWWELYARVLLECGDDEGAARAAERSLAAAGLNPFARKRAESVLARCRSAA